MAGERKLTIIIGGDAKGGVAAMNQTERAAGGMGSKLAGVGKAAGVAFAAIGVAAVGVAVKSANTFAKVGGEVLKLKRFTGLAAEDASRLRFAGKQAGLDVEVLTKSLGVLSKNVVGTKLDKLNLGLKDASGNAKPLHEDLLILANRFEKMPDGASKTALAMQLFGRSGAAMIPFLNKGAAGIAELEKQSDKYGNTLSSKDLDSVKESTKNHRLFSSAMEGLQIQIGRYVLPIMTKWTAFVAGHMPQVIARVRAIMEKLAPVFEKVGKVLAVAFEKGAKFIGGTLIPTLVKLGTWVANHKPILIGLATAVAVGLVAAFTSWAIAAGTAAVATIAAAAPVIALGLAIAALVAGIVWVVQNFDIFKNAGAAAFNWVKDAAGKVVSFITDHWRGLLQILTGPFGLAATFIIDHFNGIVSFFTGLPGKIGRVGAGMWDWIKDAFRGALNWVIDRWNGLQFKLPDFGGLKIAGHTVIPGFHGPTLGMPDIHRLGAGAIVHHRPGGVFANIAEAGQDEVVSPLSKLKDMIGGGADRPIVVHQKIYLDGKEIAENTRTHWERTADRNGYPSPLAV